MTRAVFIAALLLTAIGCQPSNPPEADGRRAPSTSQLWDFCAGATRFLRPCWPVWRERCARPRPVATCADWRAFAAGRGIAP